MAPEKVHTGKRLIVNADDFGLHPSINAAVAHACADGILTSASLAVTGGAYDGAVDIAKREKGLSVGIHLTLTEERPACDPARIPSLVAKDGRLIGSYTALCVGLVRGKVKAEHVRLECEAQLERFARSGLKPTHLDSHQHVHLFPPIFAILRPLIRRYGIERVRSLKVPFSSYDITDPFKLGFAVFSRWLSPVRKGEYRTPDHFIGFFRSGAIDTSYVAKAISGLKDGVTEIAVHPGTDNGAILEEYAFWKARYGWKCDWEREYRLLLEPELKAAAKRNGVSIVNYSSI